MELLLVYGLALLIAVLFSEWSRRTILSSAVLFLVAGYLVGPLGFDLIQVSTSLVTAISELALFSILFSDGLKLSLGEIGSAWRLPGRALLIAMPITAMAVALLARILLHLPWVQAWLVGAILSPTDPVFASAIVGREEIPGKVRHLLNVESGLNDGLALPFVVGLIGMASGGHSTLARDTVGVVGGLALGAGVAAGAGLVRRLRVFAVARTHEPLLPFAVAAVILAAATLLHVNEYLAAFAGGIALSTVSRRARDEFHDIGERLSGLLKLAAVLLVAIAVAGLPHPPWRTIAFALLVLGLARTVPLMLALIGSGLSRDERLVAAWFGPKGFASMIYGVMVLNSSIEHRTAVFQIVADVVILSIVVHSSTDVPVVKYFARRQ